MAKVTVKVREAKTQKHANAVIALYQIKNLVIKSPELFHDGIDIDIIDICEEVIAEEQS